MVNQEILSKLSDEYSNIRPLNYDEVVKMLKGRLKGVRKDVIGARGDFLFFIGTIKKTPTEAGKECVLEYSKSEQKIYTLGFRYLEAKVYECC
jgi:hypothetical protein